MLFSFVYRHSFPLVKSALFGKLTPPFNNLDCLHRCLSPVAAASIDGAESSVDHGIAHSLDLAASHLVDFCEGFQLLAEVHCSFFLFSHLMPDDIEKL